MASTRTLETMSDISGAGLLEAVLAVSAGIGLAAAAGLRIFVPLLAVSVAGMTGHLDLAPGTTWLDSLPALVTLSVAVALEIAGYFLPALDHVLDARWLSRQGFWPAPLCWSTFPRCCAGPWQLSEVAEALACSTR
jgi:hypothetical protein